MSHPFSGCNLIYRLNLLNAKSPEAPAKSRSVCGCGQPGQPVAVTPCDAGFQKCCRKSVFPDKILKTRNSRKSSLLRSFCLFRRRYSPDVSGKFRNFRWAGSGHVPAPGRHQDCQAASVGKEGLFQAQPFARNNPRDPKLHGFRC